MFSMETLNFLSQNVHRNYFSPANYNLSGQSPANLSLHFTQLFFTQSSRLSHLLPLPRLIPPLSTVFWNFQTIHLPNNFLPAKLASFSMVCPWPFMAALDPNLDKQLHTTAKPSESTKSFAQVLADTTSDADFLVHPPPKVIMGDSVRIRISKAAYESGLAACRTHLHGRLTLHKGDSPVTTLALKERLNKQWPKLKNWCLIPLGKGFFEFRFGSIEEMRKIWAIGTVNLNPGLLRFFRWSKDFSPQAQAQTHAQIWVRFMNLPQEYW